MSSRARQARSWKSSLLLAASAVAVPFALPALPLPQFVAGLLLAEALALGAVYLALRSGRRSVALLFLVALAGRLAWMGTDPVREDDYYRYLWDGNTVLSRVHPYRYAPHDVLGAMRPQGDLKILEEQRREAPEVFARISHPDLPTIYPPLSLAVFACVQAIAPWRLAPLRWTFLLFDLAIIGLLVSILRRAGRSPMWAALYAWHPLVAKEFINSAHHDVVAILPLVLFVWLWQRGRTRWAAGALGLAVLGKLFPIVAAPIYFAALKRDRWSAVATFAGVFVLGYLPVAGPDMFGSLGVFAAEWHYNDGPFAVLLWALGSETAAKIAAGLLLAGFIGFLMRRPSPRACGLAIAALFLLSPVQHPWYALWFLPFLALYPSGPLLLMTLTVPLYYLQFLGESTLVLWLEHAPVWLWLFLEPISRWRAFPILRPGNEPSVHAGTPLAR